MKTILEYLEQSVRFEQMAAQETDEKLIASLLEQAAAYHRLAAKRASQLKVPLPQRPEHPN